MGVLEAAPPPHPLGATVALRCAARAWLAGGPVRPSPPDADKEGGGFDVWLLPGAPELASLALHAWRVYARTTVMSNRAEQLSGAVPLLVARIGDRRREERAWTAWRLWLARRRLLRAEAQVGDHEELLEQRDALQRELSEARGAHEAQMQELREAYARKESAGTRGGGGGGGDAPAGAATGGGATPRTATTASGARTKSPRGTSAGSGGSGSMRAAALVATARGGRGSSGGGAGSARSPPRGSVGSGGRAGALPYPQLSPPQPHLQLCYTHPGGAPGGALPLPFYHSAGGSLPHYTGPAGLTQPHAVVHIPTGLWGGRGGGGSYGGSAGGEHYAATGAPVTHMQARASLPHAHTLMAPAASPPPPLLTYDDSYVGALFHVVPAAHVPPAPHRAGGDRAAPQAEQPQRGGHPLPQPQPWPQPAASGGPSLIRRIEPGGPHAHGAHAAPPAVATRAPLQPATRAATSAGGGWPRAASAGGAAADRKVSSVGGGAAGAAATAAARPESGPKRPAWGAGRGVAAPPPAAGGAGVVAPAEGEPPGGDRTSVSARASAITSAVARLSSDLHAHTRLHAAAAAVSPRVVQEGAGVGVLMVPVSPSRAPAGDSAREQLQVSPPIGAGSPRDHMLLARRTFDATGSDAAAPTALLVPGQQQQQQQQQAPQGYALPGGASAGGTQHMHEHAGGAEEADEGMPVARTVPPPQPTPAADQTQQQQTQQQQARRAPPPPGSRLHQAGSHTHATTATTTITTQGTLSSHVKRRDCGLPGGIANLASVPPPAPAAAPPSVPLSTYVAPAHLGRASSSTGAPAAGSAPAGSSSGVAEAVVAPGAAPVAAAAAAAAAMAVARALGEAAGLAVHGQEVPHGRRSVAYPHGVPGPAEPVGLPGSKHASHAYHGGTAGAGAAASGSSSSAAERLGLPPPGGGTRAAVRFELAGGHGQAGAAPPAGSGGAATFVMLPQPARFDISKMTR
ncbi:hypothetical protein FOA52_001660 [Chlamydomonas sp. UWO 241]|nr:hypothetical protein FOA52_001660 [Chlamydomonas sp. UWO 241]